MNETLVRELSFEVVDAQPLKLFIGIEFVSVLARILNEPVGKDLNYLGSIKRTVRIYLPLEQIFLKVKLHSEKRIVLRPNY